MRKRRTFVTGLMVNALWAPRVALSQQHGRLARIGILVAEAVTEQAGRLEALRAGLRDLGYVEGRNITLELRSAEGQYARLPLLASELADLKPDVVVAFGIKALVAARQASATTPIVIPATSSDLIAMKLIRSLARPGGNITGSTTFGSEVMSERLELIKDALPRLERVAVLENPANTGFGPAFQQMRLTAQSLKLALLAFGLRTPGELDGVFDAMARQRIDAVVVQDDTLFAAHARTLAGLALRHRLPTVGSRELADAGALIGYGRNEADLYRRGAHFVDRILKGAVPGELPIEQATRFELIANMKTARALGLKLPQSLLVRADKVIE